MIDAGLGKPDWPVSLACSVCSTLSAVRRSRWPSPQLTTNKAGLDWASPEPMKTPPSGSYIAVCVWCVLVRTSACANRFSQLTQINIIFTKHSQEREVISLYAQIKLTYNKLTNISNAYYNHKPRSFGTTPGTQTRLLTALMWQCIDICTWSMLQKGLNGLWLRDWTCFEGRGDSDERMLRDSPALVHMGVCVCVWECKWVGVCVCVCA